MSENFTIREPKYRYYNILDQAAAFKENSFTSCSWMTVNHLWSFACFLIPNAFIRRHIILTPKISTTIIIKITLYSEYASFFVNKLYFLKRVYVISYFLILLWQWWSSGKCLDINVSDTLHPVRRKPLNMMLSLQVKLPVHKCLPWLCRAPGSSCCIQNLVVLRIEEERKG